MSKIAFRIYTNRPMPPLPKPRGRRSIPKYPWDDMEVGDSFLFPKSLGRHAHTSARNASRDGKLFRAFLVSPGRYGCWRVA